MFRNLALLIALGAAAWSCRDSGSAFTPGPPRPTTSKTISASPTRAFASSPDITVTITGSGFGGSQQYRSGAVWLANGQQTRLATAFVNDTVLTAMVTAELLRQVGVALLSVESGDPTSDNPPTDSNPIEFAILARTPGFSVDPASAQAGGADVTITVQGTGFHHNGWHDVSEVVVSINGASSWLPTSFVDSSTLTAVVPAALLTKPVVAVVSVWTGDPMAASGEGPESWQGAADFSVTP